MPGYVDDITVKKPLVFAENAAQEKTCIKRLKLNKFITFLAMLSKFQINKTFSDELFILSIIFYFMTIKACYTG